LFLWFACLPLLIWITLAANALIVLLDICKFLDLDPYVILYVAFFVVFAALVVFLGFVCAVVFPSLVLCFNIIYLSKKRIRSL
jgi:hypothetical protein